MGLFNRLFSNKHSVDKVIVQTHFAEYVAFLMQLFTDFEDIQITFKLKNKPNNLNGLIDFAFFLDMVTSLPDIFKEYKTLDMDDVIYRFIKDTVHTIPGLRKDFGETRMRQATERVKLYSRLLNDDLNNLDTCNYQSIREFLKEVFSGNITEEEQVVIINILHRKLSATESLIMMTRTSSSVDNIVNTDHNKCNIAYSKSDALFFFIDGVIYERDGKYDDAIINYKKVTELYSESAAAYYKMGEIYRKKHERDKAISNYTFVIEIEPNNFFAHYYRGILYNVNKQYDQAISDFNKAIAILPTIEKSFLKENFIYLWSFESDYVPLCKLLTTLTSSEEKVLRLSLGVGESLVYNKDDKSFSTHFKPLDEKTFNFDVKKYSDDLNIFLRLAYAAKKMNLNESKGQRERENQIDNNTNHTRHPKGYMKQDLDIYEMERKELFLRHAVEEIKEEEFIAKGIALEKRWRFQLYFIIVVPGKEEEKIGKEKIIKSIEGLEILRRRLKKDGCKDLPQLPFTPKGKRNRLINIIKEYFNL